MTKNTEYEARRQAAFRRLGTDKPVCVCCGHSDWRALEAHHIAGQKHHDDTAVVCRNCHRVLSDGQRDHPQVGDQDSTLGRYLLGLAEILIMIAKCLRDFGLALIAAAQNPNSNPGAAS